MKTRSGALFLVLWWSAHADTLTLRNGTRVTGRWWATDADVVSFLVNDHLERYERSEVTQVVFGSEPATNSTPAFAAPASAAVPPRANVTPGVAPVVAEPDQVGAIYFQEDSGKLLALERAECVPHPASGDGRTGIDAPGQSWGIAGPRSPFRLKSDSRMLFIVAMPSGIAPGTFSLYPLETRGAARRTKAGIGSGPAMTIPLTARNVTGNIYVLAPVDALPPGEYSFSPANSYDAYCFGIDPAAPAAR